MRKKITYLLTLCSVLISTVLVGQQSAFTGVSNGDAFCIGAGSMTLNATNNNTGTFSGPGVSNTSAGVGSFNPVSAGPGTKQITYTVNAAANWLKISTGGSHTLGVKSDGTLWAWGYNSNGQLGNGSTTQSLIPVRIGTASNWVSVAASNNNFSVALKSDGTLWAWGYNGNGQLGNGTTTQSSVPVQVGTATNWSAFAVGNDYTMAIKSDGTLWAWGYNGYGQFGNGTTNSSYTPVQIGSGTNWSKVDCGSIHTIALKTDGTLWSWGYNGYGQLGVGNYGTQYNPQQVGTATNWSFISANQDVTMAIKSDGTLWGCGYNYSYNLAQGNTSSYNNLVQIGAATDWAQVDGNDNSCMGVKTDGTLWIWANNSNGLFGNGSTGGTYVTTNQMGTATNWSSSSIGGGYSISTKTNGNIYVAGYNGNGQLGDGTTTTNSTYTLLSSPDITTATVTINADDASFSYTGSGIHYTNDSNPTPVITGLAGGTFTSSPAGLSVDGSTGQVDLTSSTAGTYSITYTTNGTCPNSKTILFYLSNPVNANFTGVNNNDTICLNASALTLTASNITTGTFSGDGVSNTSAGIGSFNPTIAGIGNHTVKYTINSAQLWIMVSASSNHTLAIKEDGTLWAWGYNGNGQLGDGTNTQRLSPVQIGTANNWVSVVAGSNHSFGIKSDGTLWAWGYNGYGEYGNGTTTTTYTPIQIGTATNWVSVKVGDYHTLALKSDGTLWAAGRDYEYQTGLGYYSPVYSFTQVGTSTWQKIAASGNTSMAIKSDGTLWGWGNNNSYNLGLGYTGNQSSPTQIGTATNWSKISVNYNSFLAIKTDGTLWGAGSNGNGELGNGSTGTLTTIAQIGTATNWNNVSLGANHSLGIKANGTLWAWGYNGSGQFGNGTTTTSYNPTQIGTATNWANVSSGNSYSFAQDNIGFIQNTGNNSSGELGNNTTTGQTSFSLFGSAMISSKNVVVKADNASFAYGSSVIHFTTDNTIAPTITGLPGGTFSSSPAGLSINTSTGVVDASTSTTGTYTVTYTTNGACPNSSSKIFYLSLPQNAAFTGVNNNDTICLNASPITLTATNITTGTFSGPGVSNTSAGTGSFNPTTAGLGNQAITYTISAPQSWIKVATSDNHTLAIKEDGTLWAWGYNGNGQLGDGTTTQRLNPVQIGTATNWVHITTGTNHSFGIKSDGTLWAWGNNSYGQYGNGTSTTTYSPTQIGTATNWVSVKVGDYHTLALKSDGTLWAAGRDYEYQTGLAYYSPVYTFTQVGTGTNWAKIAAQGNTSMAIKTDGTLWGWGYNYNYNLGLGYTNMQSTPIQIGTATNWAKISMNNSNGIGIKTDGTLWAWGNNGNGELGNGSTSTLTSPTQIGSASTWNNVALGINFGLGTKTDGTLWAWGNNGNGQYGNGTTTTSYNPVQIGTATNWVNVYGGNSTSYALPAVGFIYYSGANYNGEFGNGTTTGTQSQTVLGTPSSVTKNVFVRIDNATFSYSNTIYFTYDPNPTPTVSGLSGGTFTSSPAGLSINPATGQINIAASTVGNYAITYTTNGPCPNTLTQNITISNPINADFTGVTEGEVFCYAAAPDTLKATNIMTGSFSGPGVTNITPGTGLFNPNTAGVGNHTIEYTIDVENRWTQIATGTSYVLAIDTDGRLWTWGNNGNGQLGNGSTGSVAAPVQLGTASNWAKVAAGSNHSVAVKTDGTLWAWGNNGNGQLGNGTTNQSFIPVQIGTATNWASVSCGETHTIALKTNGTLWAWGNNGNGQLGNGTNNQSLVPIQVGTATNWAKIEAGSYYNMAIKSNGTLWAWGANGNNQLGNGTGYDSNTPVQIGTETNWSDVNAGYFHTLALKTNGTLWAWGSNNYGQIGNGTTNQQNTPIQIGNANTWKSITASNGYYFYGSTSKATRTDGTLWAWGHNGNGQYGNGGSSNSLSPVQIGIGTNWNKVYSGEMFSLQTQTNSSIWETGYNGNGQLGNGTIGGTSYNLTKVLVTTQMTSDIHVSVTLFDDPSFHYNASTYCVNASDPIPTITGVTGGEFSSTPTGLVLDTLTGSIDLSASTPGIYSVTYTTLGACTNSSSVPVTIKNISTGSETVSMCTSYTWTANNHTYTTSGTYTATLTNSIGCDSIVTLNLFIGDTIAPTITCPANITVNNLPGNCGRSVNYQMPIITDNCSTILTQTDGTSLTSGNVFPIGITNQSYLVTDLGGNTATCSFTITVTDAQAPVFSNCPANITLNASATACSAVANWSTPVASDNCSGVVVTSTHTPGSTFSTGTPTTVTYTATDASGNTATCSFTVTVIDNSAPVVPVLTTINAQCSATVTAPVAQDNCAGPITGTTTDPLTYSAQGTYTVHWTFNDGNGNTSTANQTVIVNDNTPPVVPFLATVTSQCSTTLTAPTTTDNCSGTVTGTTTSPLTYSAEGLYNVVWTFTDANGNSSQANQIVVVDDITAPATPTLATLTGQCSVTATAPTTTDNCAGTITGTTADPLTYSAEGTYTIHWTFNDGHGNSTTANQTVVVDDITVPVTPTLATLTGQCSVTATTPTTTDNCAGTITGTTTDPLTYSAEGTYTIHWTFNDGHGNSTTANQIVVVDDITAPVTPTLATLTGQCSVTATAPTTTDNCAGTITGTTTDPLTYSAEGTYTIHWTFNDGHGNSTTANQTVVVDDITAPATPTLATLTGQCSVTATAPTTTDNCAGTITGTTTDPLTYSAEGTYTIHWTFNDGHGNSTTANQTVVLDDITAPATPTLATLTGQCSVTATAPTTTDNCAGTTTGTTTDPLTYSAEGTYTIHWTFNDGHGNSTTANQTVVVDDITAPVTPTLATLTGQCSVTATAPTTTDNCAGTITGTTTDPLTYSAEGTYTIHWTFNDGHGNSTTANQTVVVDDNTAPVVPFLATVTGQCSATLTAPVAQDNCAGPITGTTTSPTSYSAQGIYAVVWEFNDGHGNSSFANQMVIVNDNTAPVVPTLATLISQCSVTATAPTTTDNCAGTITGTTTDPLTYSAEGTYTIHWSFNDGHGNTSTANQTVIVDDITAPVTPTLATLTGQCSVTTTAPTTTDNCAGTITGTTTDPLTYATQGTYTIHWMFNDGHGNTSTADQTVIVNDDTAPMLPMLATVTGECSATVAIPTTTDNCSGTVTGTTTDPLFYDVQGNYSITWTFTDANGNSITATQAVVIQDTVAPIVPALTTITGTCELNAVVPTAQDGCSGTITGTTTTVFPITTTGTTTVIWTFEDAYGNISTVSQDYVLQVLDVTTTVMDNSITANNSTALSYQWYDCTTNTIIVGETGQSFVATQDGTYAVIITSVSGCSDTSDCVTISHAGINTTVDVELLLYPNPTASGSFTIQYNGEIIGVSVFDMSGRQIENSLDTLSHLVTMPDVERGKYLIRITTDTGITTRPIEVIN